jgi:uncharacterized membrane protein
MQLHSLIAYLPSVLFSAGALLDTGGLLGGRRDLRRAAGLLVLCGAVASLAAFVSGNAAVHDLVPRGGPAHAASELHAFAGALGAVTLAALGAFRFIRRGYAERGAAWDLVAVSVAVAVLSIGITFTGMRMAHAAV